MSARAALIAVVAIVLLLALGPQVAADIVSAVINWIKTFITEVV